MGDIRMTKFYKFKSPEPLLHVLDIIFNMRLYCSDWSKLKDPMEGWFDFIPSNSPFKKIGIK
jgi:hypothetical protein